MNYFNQKILLALLLAATVVAAAAVTLENGDQVETVQVEAQETNENIEIDTLTPENVKETEADLLADVTEIGDDLDSALVYWNLTEGSTTDSSQVDRAWGMAITDTPQQVETLGAGLDPKTEYSVEAYSEPVIWNDEIMLNNFNDQYTMVAQEHEESIQNLGGLSPLTADLADFSDNPEQTLDIDSEGIHGERDIFVSPDGKYLFLAAQNIGAFGSAQVERYDLEEPWDLTSHPYHTGDASPDQTISPVSVYGFDFNPEGDKMYIAEGGVIQLYELDTPWHLESATQTQELSVESPQDVFISPDGFYLYTLGRFDTELYRYDLEEPWDLTSHPEHGDNPEPDQINNEIGSYESMKFSLEGGKIFTIDDSGPAEVYNLENSWDISSISQSSQELDINDKFGIHISTGGEYIFASESQSPVERYGLE